MDPATDCTIIIPIPRSSDSDSAPRMVFRLHTEYLVAKSVFLRGLFSGASPLDLVQSRSRLPLRIPHSRLPRLLPSPPSHPVVFLPVPDPSSIQPLFHWMYFGNTDHLENALNHGDIQWQGLARNVEYLGLPTDIKVFLGRWYRDWFLPAPVSTPYPSLQLDDSDESDLDSDSDCDGYYSPSSPNTDDEMHTDDDSDRGRSRNVKPLVQLCAQLRLCTT